MKIRKNGAPLTDTRGEMLHAHGGHMLQHGGYYYWYGEDRQGDAYVSCYRSRDLENWEWRGHILSADTPVTPLPFATDSALLHDGKKINIERPKVLFNGKTGKFVMWAHYENGKDYHCAGAALASSDRPDGGFTYHGSFNPCGEMSRDCTLYTENGVAFFISAANDNADLHIYRLTPDWLGVEKLEKVLFRGKFREAPAFFTAGGRVFLLTSQCTGWKPNQCGYAYADSILGDWSPLQAFGDDTTYRSQPAFVLPLVTADRAQLLYVGDRWGGSDWNFEGATFRYADSAYYLSALTVDGTQMTLPPCDTYTLDAQSGFTPL